MICTYCGEESAITAVDNSDPATGYHELEQLGPSCLRELFPARWAALTTEWEGSETYVPH